MYQKCPDRLKIKRYLGGKREEGAGAASTSEGGPEELQESALYNSITASITAAGRPSASGPSKIKVELEVPNSQKSDVVAAVEISGSSKSFSTIDSDGNAEKKQKSETAKVDLKSYMDRMKERRPDSQLRNAADSPSTATARKSFMPDVSTMKEAERHESRPGDRHGRYRNNPEAESKTHSQRPQGNASGSYRHEQRPSGAAKPTEQGRQHFEGAPSDGVPGKRRHNEMDHDTGEPGKKITKMGIDNGGGHGSNRPKESSKSGGAYGGDPKVSAVPKSGYGATANVNGVAWDETREKPPKPAESDGYSASPPKPVQSSNQVRVTSFGIVFWQRGSVSKTYLRPRGGGIHFVLEGLKLG